MGSPRRLPAFESLEARTLLSGSVVASLSHGILTLTGDSKDNVISLTRDGDTVTITPDSATSINRGPAGQAIDLLGVTGAIRINMGSGNDRVAIAGQAVGGVTQPFAVGGGTGAADLTIDLGNGNDQLLLAGVAARNISIKTGSGTNGVTITALDPDGAAGGPADVQTAASGDLTVQGGSGDDTVELKGIDVAGDVTLKLSYGGNTAAITPFAGSDANFDVTIGGNFIFDSTLAFKANTVLFDDPAGVGAIDIAGSVRITLGLRGDSATVTSAADFHVGGSMFVSGCYGDDAISMTDAKVDGLLIVYGGAGNNAVNVDNVDVGRAQWIDGKLTVPSLPAGWSSWLTGLSIQWNVNYGSLSRMVTTFFGKGCGIANLLSGRL